MVLFPLSYAAGRLVEPGTILVLIMRKHYSVHKAFRLPYESVRSLARFRPHVNGSVLMIRQLSNAQGAKDLTSLFADAV